MKYIRIVAILMAAAGCASANLAALRDPAYANHEFNKVAVFAEGMYRDTALLVEREACSKLAPVQCVSGMQLLSPTQTYSPAGIRQALTQANVDGVLIVMLADDQVASAFLKSIVADSSSSASAQAATASLYGNLASWAASSQRTTTENALRVPIFNYQRAAHAIVGLFDRNSGKTAWGGQLNVSAQGEASVAEREFIDAATTRLAVELKQKRLVRIPITPSKDR